MVIARPLGLDTVKKMSMRDKEVAVLAGDSQRFSVRASQSSICQSVGVWNVPGSSPDCGVEAFVRRAFHTHLGEGDSCITRIQE
jgi:hypothetical protein